MTKVEPLARRSTSVRLHAIKFTQPSMAKQAFKSECDINTIMRRFEKDAVLDHVSKVQGRYEDFTRYPGDFEEAMALVTNAREMFLTIPSTIRDRFDNDPGAFLDFAQDPANEDAMREMGLLPPADKGAPAPVPSGTPEGPQGASDSAGGAGDPSPSTGA